MLKSVPKTTESLQRPSPNYSLTPLLHDNWIFFPDFPLSPLIPLPATFQQWVGGLY